jgi:predicted permease
MARIAAILAVDHRATNASTGAQIVPLMDQITGAARPALVLVWLAVGLILMVACANVAHLLLARTMSRQHELAIRASLGASSTRLLRVIGTESMLLVLTGGLLGGLLASILLPLFKEFAVNRIPRIDEIVMSKAVSVYTLAAMLITTVLISIPSFIEARGAKVRHSGRRTRLARIIMTAEVALSFLVFAGTLLLARSFNALLQLDPGFDSRNTLALTVNLPRNTDGWEGATHIFENQLAPHIRELPGVEAVATTNMAPMMLDRTESSRYTSRFTVKAAPQNSGSYPVAQIRWVSDEYFRVLRIPLLEGRALTARDRGTPWHLINETLARRFFPGESPIGKQLITGIDTPGSGVVEIAGVVGDVRDLALDREPVPTIYSINTSPGLVVLVRVNGNPLPLAPDIQEIVRRADPDATVTPARTVDQLVDASLARYRFALWLMVGFAVLAAVLCVVGIYGVVSFSTTRRLREFGIRAALGATRWRLMRLVLSSGLAVAAMGICFGLALYLSVSRLFQALLFQVSPTDVAALAIAGTLVSVVTIASTALPARRASQVLPTAVLRHE